MNETVGKYLKALRESKGITIEEVAEETKIQKRYLIDIEKDEFENLPGEAYIKGFLRNYSTVLKINSDEVIEMYKKMQNQNKEIEDEKEEIEESKDKIIERGKVKKLNVTILVLILGLFLFGIYVIVKNGVSSNKNSVQSVVEEKQTEEAATVDREPIEIKEVEQKQNKEIKTINTTNTAITQQAVITGEKVFEITLKGESWLEIKEGKKIVYSGTAKAGEKKVIKSSKKIYIKAGNAINLNIKLNGQDLGVLGETGKIFKKTWE